MMKDVEIISKSDCEFIVRYYGFFCFDFKLHIVMELMATDWDKINKQVTPFPCLSCINSTLFYQLPEGKLIPENIVSAVARSTRSGMHYLEDKDMMHRDIKVAHQCQCHCPCSSSPASRPTFF